MKINYYPEPFPHVVMRDYFEPEELELIWAELKFLTKKTKLMPPENTSTATGEDGQPLKRNYGLFFYDAYRPNILSDIFRCSSKLFYKPLMEFLAGFHFIFKYLEASNKDDLLLSYYDNGCYYKPHKDGSILTAIVNLHKEPKLFDGGDLIFPEYDNYRIAVENNRMVIFPSQMQHAVETVVMEEQEGDFSGNGRYSITTLIKLI